MSNTLQERTDKKVVSVQKKYHLAEIHYRFELQASFNKVHYRSEYLFVFLYVTLYLRIILTEPVTSPDLTLAPFYSYAAPLYLRKDIHMKHDRELKIFKMMAIPTLRYASEV